MQKGTGIFEYLIDSTKYGSNSADLCTQPSATVVDNIAALYGVAVSKEVLQVSIHNDEIGFVLQAWVTNANYSVKKKSLILFINSKPLLFCFFDKV